MVFSPNFDPRKIATQLDEIAEYVEKAQELTEAQRVHFAHQIDEVTDEFEKVSTELGFRTKEGKWILGDKDEDRYMDSYDKAGPVMDDADEDKKFMGKFENYHETAAVADRKEPPTRDLDTTVKQPGGAWKSNHLDKSLPVGNRYNEVPDTKMASEKKASVTILPKRKIN